MVKDLTPFVEKTTLKKVYYDEVMEALEKECVNDGVIDYALLPKIYMNYAPKRVSPKILYELLTGYTIRLEYKFPSNKRARSRMYNEVCRLDDEIGLFKTQNLSYLSSDDI